MHDECINCFIPSFGLICILQYLSRLEGKKLNLVRTVIVSLVHTTINVSL